ncbi:hypothetical protein QR680_000086 [Steinernema hermaphroditum]|uniref:Fucosyltransferase n=1 Tax=Steinernema hermaphroditum TaxID=289476 RepID=A0AA39GV99_9BILA|nr:hypothetical protein QR680_000086 [Steinernema hermaphroditum]
MSSGDGGDLSRRRSAVTKQRRKYTDRHGLSGEVPLEDADDVDIDLNIRVKEKDGIVPETRNTMSKISLKAQSNHEKLKETFKRPLTGLFRAAKGNKEKKSEPKEEQPERISPAASSTSVSNIGNGAVTSGVKQLTKLTDNLPTDTERSYQSDSGKPQITSSSMNVTRVQPDLYLDSIMMKYPQLSKLDDIDISVLARYLCTEEESCDEHVSWTWDYLFASVSSEIREDWAFEDDLDDDPYDSAINLDQQRTRPMGIYGVYVALLDTERLSKASSTRDEYHTTTSNTSKRHQNNKPQQPEVPPQEKLILFWTTVFGNKNPVVDDCSDLPVKCRFTVNRSLLTEADAVIFHGDDIRRDDLAKRVSTEQRFVFWTMESLYMGFSDRFEGKLPLNYFNWTMTVSRKSDVRHPYGGFWLSPDIAEENGVTPENLNFTYADFKWDNRKKAVFCIIPPGSYIAMDDFPSAEAMGKHLHYLMGNHTAYLEYFKWRTMGWTHVYSAEGYRLECLELRKK